MNKKQLKRLATNPNHIPGIYNYCDRWCERCAFTARCLNYAMGAEEGNDLDSLNIESETFWKKFEENLTLAAEMLQEMAEQHGIDLNNIDVDPVADPHERLRAAAESHDLSRRAKKYYRMVDSWFKKIDLSSNNEKKI